jgi:hypothetical protein
MATIDLSYQCTYKTTITTGATVTTNSHVLGQYSNGFYASVLKLVPTGGNISSFTIDVYTGRYEWSSYNTLSLPADGELSALLVSNLDDYKYVYGDAAELADNYKPKCKITTFSAGGVGHPDYDKWSPKYISATFSDVELLEDNTYYLVFVPTSSSLNTICWFGKAGTGSGLGWVGAYDISTTSVNVGGGTTEPIDPTRYTVTFHNNIDNPADNPEVIPTAIELTRGSAGAGFTPPGCSCIWTDDINYFVWYFVDDAYSSDPITATYAFSHWNTASDNSGIRYNAGEEGIIITGDLDLYAIPSSTPFKINSITLPTLTRANANFLGWSLNADLSGPLLTGSYQPFSSMEEASNILLYAKFEEIAEDAEADFDAILYLKTEAGWVHLTM